MRFVSVWFLLFVVVLCVTYFLFPKKYRWTVLLAASYIFYIISSLWLVAFLILTSLSIYVAARLLDSINTASKAHFEGRDEIWLEQNKKTWQAKYKRQKRWILIATLLLNFGLLIFFKYFGLFSWIFGLPIGLKLLIPLGISYYTFQSTGYVIDVFYGRAKAEKNVFKFALFTSFFPQIIQGPISRFSQLAPQLYEGHDFEWKRVRNGILLAVWGIFKMLCISVPALEFFKVITDPAHRDLFGGGHILFAMLVYCIYVYGSFSGGIDIARGVAQILGINMVENFRRPFFASSMFDFWRRWHITLGEWMRDYVRYPITLSKTFNKINKKFRTKFKSNFMRKLPMFAVTFFVFFLIGMWHGVEFKYILYGIWNGTVVSIGVLIADPLRKWGIKHPKLTRKNLAIRIIAIIGTVLLFASSRLIVAADTLSQTGDWIARLFSAGTRFDSAVWEVFPRAGINTPIIIAFALSVAILFIAGVMQERGTVILEAIDKKHFMTRAIIYAVFVFAFIALVYIGGEVIFVYERF